MSEARQFFRLRFTKQGDVRFISHHDLMRLFARALRRVRLPVAMSQGFNPRPQISLPAALGVGIEGRNEVLDFELDEWTTPDEVGVRLEAGLPDGIRLTSLQNVPAKQDRRPKHLSYCVPLLEGHPVTREAIEGMMAARELVVERNRGGKSKTVDIRPFIGQVRLRGGELLALLNCTTGGTARLEEVLAALGCRAGVHYEKSALVRTHVNLSASP